MFANFSLSYAIGIGLPDNDFGDQELITIADGDDLANVFKVTSFEEFLAQIDDIVAALQIVTVFYSHYNYMWIVFMISFDMYARN